MANEKVVVDVEIKAAPAIASVKSLKAELRQVTNELSNLEEGSQAFIDAATKAGELKDKIGDVRNAVDAFNPEKKFQALAGVVGIAANGFAAMQGAMALMGSESEDLNKVMAKTQGAIALTSGLNGLLGMKDAFKLLGAQVLKLIPALNSMGAAMLGAITGGIAIALVLIIAYWKDLKFLITGTIDEVKLTADEMANAVKKGHDEYKKAANERSAIAEREARLKLKGKELDLELAKIDKQRKIDEAVTTGKLASEKELIEDEYQKSIQDIKDKYAKEALEKKKKEDEKTKTANDKFNKEVEDIEADMLKKGEKKIEDDRERNNSLIVSEQERRASHINDLNEIAKDEVLSAEERYAALDELNKKGLLSDKETSEAKLAIAKAEKDARLQLLDSYAASLNAISGLVGKDTVEGKALAIASATISTYTAIAKTLAANAANTPLAIASAIGIGLTGFAAVKSIIDTPVPGQNGGGGGGGIVPTAVNIPRIPQSLSGSMLNQNRPMDINNANTTGKVIVVETDITNTQDKVKGIIRKATIK